MLFFFASALSILGLFQTDFQAKAILQHKSKGVAVYPFIPMTILSVDSFATIGLVIGRKTPLRHIAEDHIFYR